MNPDIIGNVIILVIMQTKSNFMCCLLIFKYKTWSDLCLYFLNITQYILTIPWSFW